MNEHLNIPKDLQSIISEINNIDLNFAELPMPEHPKLPNFNRTIRVYDIDAKSKQQFIVFVYEQVLRDKETGEQIFIPLPTPEWTIYKDTFSYLRGNNNVPVEVPLKDNKQLFGRVKVQSYRYMIWLMKSEKAQFIQLIEFYLQSFIEHKLPELNKL